MLCILTTRLATLSNISSMYLNRSVETVLDDLPKASGDEIRAVMGIIELEPKPEKSTACWKVSNNNKKAGSWGFFSFFFRAFDRIAHCGISSKMSQCSIVSIGQGAGRLVAKNNTVFIYLLHSRYMKFVVGLEGTCALGYVKSLPCL